MVPFLRAGHNLNCKSDPKNLMVELSAMKVGAKAVNLQTIVITTFVFAF